MSGFGGAVKLSGESQYRKALAQITQNLKEVSSEMKLVSSTFDRNDKSVEALTAKEEVLNKKLTEQNSKLQTLKAQYSAMSSQYAEQTQKHSKLVSEYNTEKSKLEEIGRTLGTTSKEYQNQKNKVDELAREVEKSTNAQDANEKSMSKMRSQINLAQADCNKTAKEIENLGKETKEAGKDADQATEGFTVFKGVVANLASTAIQSALSGLKRLGTALVNVGKEAYSSYAEYEQLTGGVETLFKDSSDTVLEYAQNAYKTAGLSANEYMETVTSFSASLLQSLNGDTAKSAEVADMAITDMSDNANKMGTSMEMIQNAYQGFAKQNYTMLDNLKLGYGGTKTEMLRLVKDAGVVEQSVKSLDEVSFAQIIEAIHRVQTNIGITGTTAKEAEGTIEGSTKSISASWKNLLVAVADGNGDISGSIEILTKNIEVFLGNAVPRIKQIVKGMWTAVVGMAKQYMPEFTNNVLPVLKDIFTVAKDVITFVVKNFKTIAPIVLGIASAFAVWNATMAVTKTIKAVTTALEGLTAGVGLATKAQAVWNATMSANPIGAVIMAVTALIAVIVALANSENEFVKAHKEEMKALDEEAEQVQANTDSWNSLKEAKQENIDAGMTEISHYENLYEELKHITDENGKVKKGYEERASFIASQLSEALGIEIDMTDGVIQKYTELQTEIDKTMEKKKAQIILDAQEPMYKEAIQKQTQALSNLNSMQDTVNAKKQEVVDFDKEISEQQINLTKAVTAQEAMDANARIRLAQDRKAMKEEEVAQAEANYEKQKSLIQGYAYDIATYEENMELAHSGQYEKMTTVNWDYVKTYKDSADSQKAMLEDQIENEETQLALLKEMKKQYGTDMFDDQIKQAQKSLTQHKKDLKAYTSATVEGNQETKVAWSNGLAEQISEITGADIKFEKAGHGNVQMVINGIKTGKPKSKEEMANLVTETINEISKQTTGATKAGEDLINGVNQGIANENVQSSVFSTIANFGAKLLNVFRGSLQEESPSKATRQMGRFLLDGFGLGVEDEEQTTLNQITGVGKRVVDALQSEISQGTTFGEITVNAKSAKDSNAYYGMVDAFKQALSDMKIELDDSEMGRFIDKTVTRIIYS